MAAVGWPETIPGTRPPPEKDVRELGIGGVYDRLVATMWEMPTTFRIGGGRDENMERRGPKEREEGTGHATSV